MNNQNLLIGSTNLDVLSQTLMQLAENDNDIVVVTSDSRGSGRVTSFAERFPKQFIDVGIAEQNLIGVSAGLASTGKKVYAIAPACFITSRALEQIKNDVAYSDHPAKIIGISAGVSYGALGTTHHSLHDFAVLQAINNIDIMAPADNVETHQIILSSVHHPRPLYIRFGKKNMPDLHTPDTQFVFGKATQLTPHCNNYDITFFAIGETVAPAFLASKTLSEAGFDCCVLSFHSLRPFDEGAVRLAAEQSKAVITVEEHSINGGLGSRVASFLMQARIFRPMKIIGIPDEETVAGTQEEMFQHYGMAAGPLAAAALRLIESSNEVIRLD